MVSIRWLQSDSFIFWASSITIVTRRVVVITKAPCEEVVWDVLPGIRAAIAEELVKMGLSQKDVSKILGLSPPAVSQYVSGKRGYSIVLNDNVKEAIGRLAADLHENKVADLTSRICGICRELRGEDSCDSRDPVAGKSP